VCSSDLLAKNKISKFVFFSYEISLHKSKHLKGIIEPILKQFSIILNKAVLKEEIKALNLVC